MRLMICLPRPCTLFWRLHVDDSGEAGYQTILAATSRMALPRGREFDPLNVTNNTGIDWSSTTTATNILGMLTEHGYDLEYRDDLQVMTPMFIMAHRADSNMSTAPITPLATTAQLLYGTVNSGSNTALNNSRLGPMAGLPQRSQIYLDLTDASEPSPGRGGFIPFPFPAPA